MKYAILLLQLDDVHRQVLGPFFLLRHVYAWIRDRRSYLGHVCCYGKLLVELPHRDPQLVDDVVREVKASPRSAPASSG